MRLTHLREKLAHKHLDGLFVTQPQNIRYLSGFTSPDASLIVTPTEALIATDFRYFVQAAEQCPDWELVQLKDKPEETLKERLAALAEKGLRRLGYEKTHLTVERYHRLRRKVLPPGVHFVATAPGGAFCRHPGAGGGAAHGQGTGRAGDHPPRRPPGR